MPQARSLRWALARPRSGSPSASPESSSSTAGEEIRTLVLGQHCLQPALGAAHRCLPPAPSLPAVISLPLPFFVASPSFSTASQTAVVVQHKEKYCHSGYSSIGTSSTSSNLIQTIQIMLTTPPSRPNSTDLDEAESADNPVAADAVSALRGAAAT